MCTPRGSGSSRRRRAVGPGFAVPPSAPGSPAHHGYGGSSGTSPVGNRRRRTQEHHLLHDPRPDRRPRKSAFLSLQHPRGQPEAYRVPPVGHEPARLRHHHRMDCRQRGRGGPGRQRPQEPRAGQVLGAWPRQGGPRRRDRRRGVPRLAGRSYRRRALVPAQKVGPGRLLGQDPAVRRGAGRGPPRVQGRAVPRAPDRDRAQGEGVPTRAAAAARRVHAGGGGRLGRRVRQAPGHAQAVRLQGVPLRVAAARIRMRVPARQHPAARGRFPVPEGDHGLHPAACCRPLVAARFLERTRLPRLPCDAVHSSPRAALVHAGARRLPRADWARAAVCRPRRRGPQPGDRAGQPRGFRGGDQAAVHLVLVHARVRHRVPASQRRRRERRPSVWCWPPLLLWRARLGHCQGRPTRRPQVGAVRPGLGKPHRIWHNGVSAKVLPGRIVCGAEGPDPALHFEPHQLLFAPVRGALQRADGADRGAGLEGEAGEVRQAGR